MTLLSHFKDLGQPRKFSKYYPHINTKTWTGRTLYWAWKYPVWAFLILYCVVVLTVGLIASNT